MGKTILIVDDSKTERVVLTGYLKAEYSILEAVSGEAAIELLRTKYKAVSAIILDVVMSGMDGFETIKAIKANAAWLQIPVIITTGLDDEASHEKAIALGADNFITKPYHRAVLLHILKTAINLREAAAIAQTLHRDTLTGLLNRESFFVEAERMIRLHDESYYMMSCLDVENFKVINDQYGTDTGDEVLLHIARTLGDYATENNGLACHYMADKFAMLFPSQAEDSDAVQRCVERLTHPECVNRMLRIRIGRYLINDIDLPVSAMYDRASMAGSLIKGRFDVYRAQYTESMRDELLHEQQIVNDMESALRNNEFEPWLQPQYNHATGALIGAEALVRWRKDGKIVPPNSFIPVFEKNGFIYEVDKSVWRQVCALLRRWLDEGKDPAPISVNISRYDLYQPDFVATLDGLLAEYRIPIDLLRLEITESAFADSSKAIINVANGLIQRGFTVEIDDFGSGYSSLNTLKDVPAAILKLDMRFFEATTDSQRGGNIIESVVRMAKWINMSVIAEGVEEQSQADYLKSIGCYYIQGYFYSKPLPVDAYEARQAESLKDPKLSRLHTLATLDNNEFWNPKSMDTLIFNSYVGGACIFEYTGDRLELLRVNDQYLHELGGLVPEGAQLKDSSIMPFLDDESKAILLSALQESIDQKKQAVREGKLVAGSHVEYVRMTARVIAHNRGSYLFYAVIVNVTEQREAEQLAQIASERVTAVMNNTKCGITAYVVSPNGKAERLFVNDRFYELMGYTPEQFQQEVAVPFDCIYSEDREEAVREALRLQEVGQSATLQMRVVRRDQSILWVRVDIAIVEFANVPHPVQLANFLDVTEQVEAERQRLESAEQLRIIMANINGSVSAILLDDAGNTQLIFGNDKYYEIFGYTKAEAEAIHLDTMSCIVPEDFGTVVEKLKQLQCDGVAIDIDYRAQKRDGSLICVRSISSRMSMAGYGDDVIVSVETDITEQRTLQDQLHAVVANINGGVSATYLKGDTPEYVVVNDKYFEIIGYTREQFAAEVKTVFDIIHPDDRERVEWLVREAARTEKPYTMEYRILRRNGAVRHILCNINIMRLFGIEEPVQLAVSNDVTVLREAQQKERDLSTQMQTIMENIHGGVTATVYHSPDDVEMVFANDGFYELYGYTREQLETELPNMLNLIVPEDREKTMATAARIVRERGSDTYEYRCRKRDGSLMWTQVTNAVISLAGVSDTVLLGIVTDITALRLAEQQNHESMDRLKAVLNAMQSGITAVAFYGDHTEFLFANERYYQMHGISREEYEQNALRDSLALVHPDDRALIHNLVLSATELGQSAEAEYRILLPNGAPRWAKATIRVTTLAGVAVPVQVTLFTDIDAEKKAAEQLRFLNDSARDILAQPDMEVAILDTLAKINAYFHADRTYVVELDAARQVTRNTYEICAEGVSPQKDNLQELAFDPSDAWFVALSHADYMVVEDVGALDGSQAALRELLLAQGIRSIIIVALRRDGQLIGFTGADNPSGALEQVSQLTALADYLAVLLTRRDLKDSYEREKKNAQLLMDDTPGGFCRMRVEPGKPPTLANMNAGFCRMLEMTAEEVTATYGANMLQCLTMEDIEAATEDSADAVSATGQFSTKGRLRKKDGSSLWVMVFSRFVKDETGQLYLNSYFTDITERKNAEQHQIELLDNLPTGAALYEFNGKELKAIHINKRYWELVEREPVAYGEASVFGAVHPDDRALVRQEIESAIRQRRNAEADCRLLCGTGGYKPFHISANITAEGNGEYLLYASYTPISAEVMSIQEMLPIALSTMVASTDDMSYVKDKDLRYICVSQAVADMAGVQNPRDFVGKTAEEMFDNTFSEKFDADDRHVIETGEAVMHALEHIPAANGGVRLARTSKFPILDANGSAVGIYCVSHDITAQKEKESQLELLTASIPGGLAAYSLSKDGFTSLYFNDGYFAYSGYTREEYVAMTASEPLALMVEEDRPKILEMVRGFAEQRTDGMTGSCTYRCRTKSGAQRWMNLKAVLSQVGEDAYILNAVQLDITDQMEVETRRAQLLDNLPFGAALFNFDGERLTAIHINKQYMRMVNREVSNTLEGFKPIDFVHPDDRRLVLDELADAIANDRDASCEVRLLYGGDEYRAFRLDAKLTPNEDGTHLLFVAYTRISEQEQSLKAMLPKMLATIMESSTDLAFAKDRAFRYLCCSATLVKLLGLASEKDVVGKTDYELFPQALADQFRHDDAALFANGKPQVDIYETVPSPDGTQHYVRTTKHLLRTVTGEAMGVYGTGREVTEEREANAQLKLLTNSIPDGIATFHCTAEAVKLVYCNDGYCQLFGYTREQYLKHDNGLLRAILVEDRPALDEQLARLIADGTPINASFRVRTREGGSKWVNCQAMAVDRIGGMVVANVVLMDMTEQQQEKERLRLVEEEYRIAAAQSSRTICRYSIAERTLTVSAGVAARLGLPECLPDVPYGRVKLGKISPETTDAYIGFFERIMRGERECSVTFRKLLNTGWRWIDARATTLFDSEGKPVSAIISYMDVTEQREKEAVYSRWQNSIAERPEDSYTLFRCNISKSGSYDSWSGKLLHIRFDDSKHTFDERTNEYVTQCVYADDRERYRVFLCANTMLAEYYRGHRTDSLEYREMNADGSHRWLRLSVDMVEYPDSSDVEAYMMYENIDERKRTELKTIERAETDPLTGVLNRATFAVRVNQAISQSAPDTHHALMMLDIDSFKLVNDIFGHGAGDQALTDIADLLTRSSRKGDLVGRLGGDEFLVFLANIPSEAVVAKRAHQICELTRKNYTVDVRTSASIGIAMYPQDGEGFESLYKVADSALYRVKDTGKNGYAFSHDEPVDSGDIRQEPANPSAPAKRVHRMLIVDDSETDNTMLAAMFKSEFRIEKALDGPTALTKLRHYGTAISVVLLDLMMPGMDGYEVLRRMQQGESTRGIPVIIVSADESRETALRVIRAGASDLVAKPVDPDILRVRVASAISRAENERLRAQNSYLAMRNTEVSSYKAALERSDILVITINWSKNEFSYSPAVSQRLAGAYDGQNFWRVLLSSMVTDTQTVERMQQLVHELAGSRDRTEDSLVVRLKTAEGIYRMFEMNVFKEADDYGLTDKLVITLREAALLPENR